MFFEQYWPGFIAIELVLMTLWFPEIIFHLFTSFIYEITMYVIFQKGTATQGGLLSGAVDGGGILTRKLHDLICLAFAGCFVNWKEKLAISIRRVNYRWFWPVFEEKGFISNSAIGPECENEYIWLLPI